MLEESSKKFYPIRTVSELTGVNSITLRAWERRYGLLVPHRTPKGHRLYTQADIDLIHQTLELLNKGISISQVKNILGKSEKPSRKPKKQSEPSGEDIWAQHRQRMLNAIVRFDYPTLLHTYNELLSLYPSDLVTQRLMLPLSRQLGDRWEDGSGTVAEEHFFTQFLRNKIGAMFHHQMFRHKGPKIIAACLPGELHENGFLIFCLAAMEHDYELISLGSDLPLSELGTVAKKSEANAILLSGTNLPEKATFAEELEDLVNTVEIPVFVGGNISVSYCDLIKGYGAEPLGNDFSHALKTIADTLQT